MGCKVKGKLRGVLAAGVTETVRSGAVVKSSLCVLLLATAGCEKLPRAGAGAAPDAGPRRAANCSPAYAPRPARDPSAMCKVEGGTFAMGSEKQRHTSPVVRVTLSPFLIDETEVTAAQYVKFLTEKGSDTFCDEVEDRSCLVFNQAEFPTTIEKRGASYVVVEGKGDHPALGISWQGAQLYCEWAGKTLPTEAQWEYAARHDPATGKDRLYPWGDALEARRANCDEARCADGFEHSSPVGRFDGRSAFGVHDMFGNAFEWVADCMSKDYGDCRNGCTNPRRPGCPGGRRVQRGEDFLDGRYDIAETRGSAQVKWGGNYTLGFRCALTESR